MVDLEQVVRSALAAEAEHAPDAAHLASAARRRSARASRTPWLAAAAAAASVLVAGSVTVFVNRPAPGTLEPGGGTDQRSAAGSGSLETHCPGLALRFEQAGDGVAPGATVMDVVRGQSNSFTVDGNHLLFLRSVGDPECAGTVRYEIVEPAGQDAAQGSSGDTGLTLHAEGVGVFVTHSETDAHLTIRMFLDCPPGAACVPGSWPIDYATVDVTIKGEPIPTRTPSPTA